MFSAESVDGVGTVGDLRELEDDIERERLPRWIQADAWRGDAPDLAARSLAPGRWNLLGVHIGPTAVHRADQAFPDSRIDFSRGDVSVTVQLELAGAAVKPLAVGARGPLPVPRTGMLRPASMRRRDGSAAKLVIELLQRLPATPVEDDNTALVGLASSAIILPPAGDSTLALFAACPQSKVKHVDGRIAIIHNNRVLQTARLSVAAGAAADQGAGVSVAAEATFHARDDDLDERRDYDVAMQLSDVGGRLHLTIQRNFSATIVQLEDLHQPISEIQEELKRVAVKWDYSKPMLKQKVFADSLYALADNGSLLEQHLRKLCGNDIDNWERIHLVPATYEFLPLEYVYNGPPPKPDATVCPNVLGALDRGSCEHALAQSPGSGSCPNRLDPSFVCPMQFWGFRRLIERNGVLRATAAPAAPAAAATPSVCVPSRQPFGKVVGMLFAASNRAFKYKTDPKDQADERAALVRSLGVLTGVVSDVADWDKWREEVKKNPNLLVLVVHTDKHRNRPVLEIGDKKFLGRSEIKPAMSGGAPLPRLLILLGCSAAGVTENFQPYPELFRDAGASIVLAPVAPIRGADAVPIAKRISQLLANRVAGPEPTAFGDLLPLLRRELLRDGHPGVMGIVGFGDGDWMIGCP